MVRWLGALPFLIAASAAHAQAPPTSGTWNKSVEEGKSDAIKRNVPLLVYVAYSGEASEVQTRSFEDPAVLRLTGQFSCVFLARDYDLEKFGASYVPWICPKVEDKYQPPLLNFGMPKVGPRADLKVAGVAMNPKELAAHLEKVLAALAPAALQKVRMETLEQSKLAELLKKLEDSLGVLESGLSEAGVAKFKEEMPWATVIARLAESKGSKEIQDKDAKKKASGLFSDLKKNLSALGQFKGKEADKFRESLIKVRETLKLLQESHS